MVEKVMGIDIDSIQPEPVEFNDPVLRCDSCSKIVKRSSLHKFGSCPDCGNKRIRNLTIFNSEERSQMIKWGFESFVNEYQAVGDE